MKYFFSASKGGSALSGNGLPIQASYSCVFFLFFFIYRLLAANQTIWFNASHPEYKPFLLKFKIIFNFCIMKVGCFAFKLLCHYDFCLISKRLPLTPDFNFSNCNKWDPQPLFVFIRVFSCLACSNLSGVSMTLSSLYKDCVR